MSGQRRVLPPLAALTAAVVGGLGAHSAATALTASHAGTGFWARAATHLLFGAIVVGLLALPARGAGPERTARLLAVAPPAAFLAHHGYELLAGSRAHALAMPILALGLALQGPVVFATYLALRALRPAARHLVAVLRRPSRPRTAASAPCAVLSEPRRYVPTRWTLVTAGRAPPT